MSTEKEINEYLYYEFGVEGDESQVGENWPFSLYYVGTIDVSGRPIQIYEFSDGEDKYFAEVGDALNFYPTGGMSLEDLELAELGSLWISRHNPVDSNTSRIGDESVPTAITRRAVIKELIERALPARAGIRVLEGLFLRETGTYLVLVEDENSGEAFALGSGIDLHSVGFPEASAPRRLAYAVGEMLREGMLAANI